MNQPNQLVPFQPLQPQLQPPTSALQAFEAYLAAAKTRMEAQLKEALAKKPVAEATKIDTDAQLQATGAALQQTLAHADTLDAERELITKPLNALLRRVNAVYQPAIKAWRDVAESGKAKTLSYMQRREAAAAQAAAAAQQMAIQQVVVGPTPQAQAYQALAAHAAAPMPHVEGIATVEDWGWETVDIRQVPPELLLVDVQKVNALVAAYKGAAVIPGIRVFRKDHLRVSRP